MVLLFWSMVEVQAVTIQQSDEMFVVFCAGIEWSSTRRSASVHFPWGKSPYLLERTQQLQSVLQDLDPHKPVRL